MDVHIETRPLMFGAVLIAESVKRLGEVGAPHFDERKEIVVAGKEAAEMLLKKSQLT